MSQVKLQHGDVLVVDTLQGSIMLAAFRKYLGPGFQVGLHGLACLGLHALSLVDAYLSMGIGWHMASHVLRGWEREPVSANCVSRQRHVHAGNHDWSPLARPLQAHMQRNELLHQVFGFTPATSRPERMSALEKRHFRRVRGDGGARRAGWGGSLVA